MPRKTMGIATKHNHLADRVKAHLVENPTVTWDSAVKAIIDEGDDSEENGDGGA
jgi:hypothetical protein